MCGCTRARHRISSSTPYIPKHTGQVKEGEERRVVDRAMAAIEAAAGHALERRRSGEEAKPVMRHTLDPIKYKQRPLLVYLATHGLANEVLGYILLQHLLGFRRRQAGHISYWHRPGTAPTASTHPPPVFVHGIGLGLIMYYHFLTLLPRQRGDIFLVELPHASLKVCEFVPSAEQAVASLRQMLAAHGHARAVFAAHSLGTVYVAWMCRYASDAVAASVFVEPICFMLFLRTLTYRFLYQVRTSLHTLHPIHPFTPHTLHYTIQRNMEAASDTSSAPSSSSTTPSAGTSGGSSRSCS